MINDDTKRLIYFLEWKLALGFKTEKKSMDWSLVFRDREGAEVQKKRPSKGEV